MRLSRTTIFIIQIVATICICAAFSFAQEADSRIPGAKSQDPDQPKSMREMQVKMQIDQEKKEYEEMLSRGEQAVKISQDLEKAFDQRSSLTRADLEKLDDLEKAVKKIRNELGGDKDDQPDGEQDEDASPKSVADAFKILQSQTVKLVDELKRSSRFGISVVAIQSSNTVLKIVRFLKFSK
jgi:hypothetical protein